MKKSAKAVFAAACALTMCLTAGCANKAEVVLPDGQTSQVELEKDGEVIDPFQYFDITFSGFNGFGSAVVNKKESCSFELDLSKQNDLSNGDKITVTVVTVADISPDVISPAYKEIEVTGLEEPQELDPFEGLELQFDGISPFTTVSFNTAGCDKVVADNIYFSTEANNLSDGDTFTVTAECLHSASELARWGYYIKNKTKEYTVDNPAKYITSVDEADFTQLNSDMDDYVEAEANATIGEFKLLGIYVREYHPHDTIGYFDARLAKVNGIEDMGGYLMSLKSANDMSSTGVYNKYYKLYRVDFSWANNGLSESGDGSVYTVIGIDNLYIDKDGNLKFGNGQDFSSDMLYYMSEMTEEELNSKHIVSEKGSYNVTEID